MKSLCVMQVLPALNVGGVERGTLEIAAALVAAGHRAIVVSGGGQLVAELEALGATHIESPIGAKRLSSIRLIRPLRRLIQQHQVDIVHARSRLPAWLAYRAIQGLPRNARPCWVTTVHGPYTVNPYSRIMTSGDAIIAISEFIRRYIEDNYPAVDRTRIRLIPRGISRAIYSDDYAVSESWLNTWYACYPATKDRHLLVLPGRLTRWKGQTDFIEMIAQLCAKGHAVHGLIAGGAGSSSAHYERELRALVSSQNLDDRISFLGHRDDLRDVLAHADIAYSLTAKPEAFGRTTAEALSLGTPMIGYEHGGTGEILKTVLPAGLVACRDIEAAVRATQAFLSNPPRVPAEHPYTLQEMQRATLETYTRVIEERTGS